MKTRSAWLRDRGWWPIGHGLWRCAVVCFGWPLRDAIRLEREAEDGDKQARRILA